MVGKKERLDKLIVDKKLVKTREKARRIIMANLVTVNGKKINKAGTKCDIDSELLIEKTDDRYVSRGGYKLEKALKEFDFTVDDKVVIDVGASTGGFTDCLLQNGARKIYCIDVGYGQLDWKLRNDQRIVNIERTNIRYVDKKQFDVLFDLATVDVSFISLEKVLPVIIELLKPEGKIIALVKPQFEAGRENIKKGGIVNDPEVHQEVIVHLLEKINDDLEFMDITFSPIKNHPGNIEYLIYLAKKNKEHGLEIPLDLIKKIITEAHAHFSKKITGNNDFNSDSF